MIELKVKAGDFLVAVAAIKHNVEIVPSTLLEYAHNTAKEMTSRYKKASGATRDAIRPIDFKDGKHAILRLQQPQNKRDRPYHLWHHGGYGAVAPNGNGPYNLKSGKHAPKIARPDFMFYAAEKTVDYANLRLGNDILKGT
jgi:hypothetical protein